MRSSTTSGNPAAGLTAARVARRYWRRTSYAAQPVIERRSTGRSNTALFRAFGRSPNRGLMAWGVELVRGAFSATKCSPLTEVPPVRRGLITAASERPTAEQTPNSIRGRPPSMGIRHHGRPLPRIRRSEAWSALRRRSRRHRPPAVTPHQRCGYRSAGGMHCFETLPGAASRASHISRIARNMRRHLRQAYPAMEGLPWRYPGHQSWRNYVNNQGLCVIGHLSTVRTHCGIARTGERESSICAIDSLPRMAGAQDRGL